jgi:hypothetical protein
VAVDGVNAGLTAWEQAIARQLIAEIDRFNIETTGIRDVRDVLVKKTVDNGRLVGGVYGWTRGGTCWNRRCGSARTCLLF